MTIEKTVSEILADGRPEEVKQLRGYGIDIDTDDKDGKQYLFVSSNHASLKKYFFKGTRWENCWYDSLSRLPGAEKNHARRFGIHVSKCVRIPMDLIKERYSYLDKKTT
jgi:hypothetical protein